MKNFNKKIKKLDVIDLKLIKLASMAGILFLITLWPAAMSLVNRIDWYWFLLVAVVLAYRPCKKILF